MDAVYHCGARVEFVYPYQMLKPDNVLGTREVLRLACHGTPKKVHYVSTLAVFSLADHLRLKTARETDIPEGIEALDLGYFQTKWVAECLVRAAANRGLPVTIYRPGIIAGESRTGETHRNDLLTRVMLSCVHVGLAPDSGLGVHVTPVDFASRAIVHLSRRPDAAGQVYHVLGQLTNWTTLLDWIGEFGYALRRVPFPEWRGALIAVPTTEPHPMTALSPFLPELEAGEDEVAGSLRQFDFSNAQAALAASGVTCPPVDAALIARYLAHAVRSGLIEPPGPGVEATAG